VTARDARFRQAAWTYAGYGLVYWLGGLVLIQAGVGPRGMERGGAAWLVVGALFVLVFPWLLARDRAWFDRWLLSRRDFARILTALVVLRAVEVARIAWAPKVEAIAVLGTTISVRHGAWAFFAITVLAAVMLGRAAWGRE
jgi:hypothetical protein